MFVANAEKTRYDFYFAVDLAEDLNEALRQQAPLHWLANRWHLDERQSNNAVHLLTPTEARRSEPIEGGG